MSGSKATVVAYGVCGGVSVVAQFSLARVTLATLSGNELGAGLFLGFWLLFGGLGSLVFSTIAGKCRRPFAAFPLLLILLGPLIPASCYLVVLARRLLFGFSFSLTVWQNVAVVACAALPVSSIFGATFAAAIQAAQAAGPARPLYLYLADAAGSFAGGLLGSLLIAPFLPTFGIALLAGAAVLVVAAPTAFRLRAGPGMIAVCLIFLVAVIAPLAVPGIYRAAESALAGLQLPGSTVVLHADSRHQSFTVTRSRDSLSFYQDGVLTFFSQGGQREQEIAHLALLSCRRPGRVLLIGAGWPFLSQEILKHPVESLDVIVEDEKIYRTGMQTLPSEQKTFLADPRLRIRYGDPTQVLSQLTQRYSAVFIDVGLPDTLLAVRFFTRRFLSELRGLLDEQGIVALSAPAVQSYLSPALLSLNASLLRTLQDVFGAAIVIPGEYAGNVFIAGSGLVTEDFSPATLSARLDERRIEAGWITRSSLDTILDRQRVADLNSRIAGASGVVNTLENPVLLLFALEYREELSASSLSLAFLRNIRLWHAAAALFVLVLILLTVQLLSARDFVVPGCAAATGFSCMVAELSLLCVFQLVAGALYESIAALVGFFMAGLALGSTGVFLFSRRPARRSTQRPIAAVLLFSFAASVLIACVARKWAGIPRAAFTVFIGLGMVLAGLGSGATVSLLLSLSPVHFEHRAGIIYGADLVGGALAGVLGSVVFLPAIGITRSLWLSVMGYGFALLLLGSRALVARSQGCV